MNDSDNISLEDALKWLVRTYTLSGGAAQAEFLAAINSGRVRYEVHIAHFGDVVERILMPALGTFFWQDVLINRDDLCWQIHQQLGTPLAATDQGTTAPDDAPTAPPAGDTLRGFSLVSDKHAEQACGEYLAALTERPANTDTAFTAAIAHCQSYGTLSRKAFDRAWAAKAPIEWKRAGRRKRT